MNVRSIDVGLRRAESTHRPVEVGAWQWRCAGCGRWSRSSRILNEIQVGPGRRIRHPNGTIPSGRPGKKGTSADMPGRGVTSACMDPLRAGDKGQLGGQLEAQNWVTHKAVPLTLAGAEGGPRSPNCSWPHHDSCVVALQAFSLGRRRIAPERLSPSFSSPMGSGSLVLLLHSLDLGIWCPGRTAPGARLHNTGLMLSFW